MDSDKAFVEGIRVAAVNVGIKQTERADLCLFETVPTGTAAAVFTQNKFAAAPVQVAKKHLDSGLTPRYLLINSGNANCGTGARGYDDAETLCRKVADQAGCEQQQVLPFSTGVIGENLPLDKMLGGVETLFEDLSPTAWSEAALAIMTTDTRAKFASTCIEINGQSCTICGITKGAGMIKPNMATMLGFIATDAAISSDALHAALSHSVSKTFNKITIDGDTSTNDAVVVLATGSGAEITANDEQIWAAFQNGLDEVCEALAKAIVADGEGATKFVEVAVKSASEKTSSTIAYTVAESPLVKTALFASDPNWGRILAAIGRAPTADFNIEDVAIFLGDYQIVSNGSVVHDYDETQAARVMRDKAIKISIDIGGGEHQCTVWTTDLSYDYIKINAEYRT